MATLKERILRVWAPASDKLERLEKENRVLKNENRRLINQLRKMRTKIPKKGRP